MSRAAAATLNWLKDQLADRQGIDRCIDRWRRAVDRVLLSPDAA